MQSDGDSTPAAGQGPAAGHAPPDAHPATGDAPPEVPDAEAAGAEGVQADPGGTVADGGPEARDSGTGRRARLGGELADFLIELSAAIQKHAMYPPGHPALAPTAEGVARRLASLLGERMSLALGVARDRLVIEGVATDPDHPLLRSLADRLHRHQLGAVTLRRGARAEELAGAFARVAEEPERTERPLGLEPPEAFPRWEHVQLHPLRFERLEIREGDEGRSEAEAHRSHLWIGLARAALAAEEAMAAGELPDEVVESADPTQVAHAIDTRVGEQAYDQVIVGYMLQIAGELKTAEGGEAEDLRNRISTLVTRLQPETLRRLLHMGGNTGQRNRFLRDATEGMAVDAVLELVQATADNSPGGSGISQSMMRLLSKMARHAGSKEQDVTVEAAAALRHQVRRLISNWELENPNPEEYEEALQRMASRTPMITMGTERAPETEPERTIQMALEVGRGGEAVWRSAERMIGGGQIADLVHLLETAPLPAAELVPALWERASDPEAVRSLVTEPPDFDTLDRILPHAGVAAASELLDLLASSDSRSVRRQIFDRLRTFGPDLGPPLLERLADERWYVQRNMLALLGELERWPADFSPAPLVDHEHPLVRLEALKLQLRQPEERDRALLVALADAHPRIRDLALTEAEHSCPPAATDVLSGIVMDRHTPPEHRAAAIRALGHMRGDQALEALLRVAADRHRWAFWRHLPPSTPELLAALGALAAGWPGDPRAADVLEAARTSTDAAVRAAVEVGAASAGDSSSERPKAP